MPVTPKTPKGTPKRPGAKGAGGKAARNKKLLILGAGLVVAVLVGLYFRSRSGSAGASTTGASPTDSGGSGSGSGPGQDLSPILDLADSVNGLVSVLGAGQGFDPGSYGADSISPFTVTSPADDFARSETQRLNSEALDSSYAISGIDPAYSGVNPPGTVASVASRAVNTPTVGPEATSANGAYLGLAPSQESARGIPAPVAKTFTGEAFGGIVSVKTLPNGSTLTTFGSGRQVQQAPGKSPYVVKA